MIGSLSSCGSFLGQTCLILYVPLLAMLLLSSTTHSYCKDQVMLLPSSTTQSHCKDQVMLLPSSTTHSYYKDQVMLLPSSTTHSYCKDQVMLLGLDTCAGKLRIQISLNLHTCSSSHTTPFSISSGTLQGLIACVKGALDTCHYGEGRLGDLVEGQRLWTWGIEPSTFWLLVKAS